MSPPLLEIRDLSKRFGGVIASDSVNLSIPEGELHAIIGPNGAGKSTLIGQLMGDIRADSGSILLSGKEIGHLSTAQRASAGLSRTFQIVQLLPEYNVMENVALAVQALGGSSMSFFDNPAWDEKLLAPARRQLEIVGLEKVSGTRASALSHGERKQLELAIALVRRPRLLLLDEPMAGLGAGESQTMVELLLKLRRQVTMLLVEHDIDAVFRLADRVSVLAAGKVLCTGTPAEISQNKDARRVYLGESDD